MDKKISISQMASSLSEILDMIKSFDKIGVGIIFNKEEINTRTSKGKNMLSKLGAIMEILDSNKLGKNYSSCNKVLCYIITEIAEGLSEFPNESDLPAYEYLIGKKSRRILYFTANFHDSFKDSCTRQSRSKHR
ncbi:recombinase family protein [Vallitalea sediminicola]